MKAILLGILLSAQLASCQQGKEKSAQQQRIDSAQALVHTAETAQQSFLSLHGAELNRYDSLKNLGKATVPEQLTGDSLKLIRVSLDKSVIENKMKLIRLQQKNN